MPEFTYREAINQALREEMQRDPTVFIMGEDIAFYGGAFKVTEGLLAEFGQERVIDTPIAEGSMVGMAVGAAMVGLRPIVELMTVNFALLAMDQIVNHAAKIRYMFGGKAKVPMVIRAPGGGGQQLAAQHSQSLESYFMHCPGLKVVYPAFPSDAKGLLKISLDHHP
jgi:pyruvate dehydrogenase E1 component beta subunit